MQKILLWFFLFHCYYQGFDSARTFYWKVFLFIEAYIFCGWTICGYRLMFVLLHSRASNLLQNESKPSPPSPVSHTLPPFAMQEPLGAISWVSPRLGQMELMREFAYVFLVSIAFMLTCLPFTPLPTPPDTFRSSPISVQDFHKMMPFILMSIKWLAIRLSSCFS